MSPFASLKLHGYWRSSSAWRVRIALEHKALRYENVSVNLAPAVSAQHTPEFKAVNAFGQVPVLELSGGSLGTRRLTQSMAIIELIDELVPSPPLLPGDAWGRAQTRRLAEIINSGIQPLQNPVVQKKVKALGGDGEAWAREFIARGLEALEHDAKGSAGRYLVGDVVSLADLYLVPQLYNARRFAVPLDAFPTLTAVEARLNALAAFAVSHPDQMPDAPKQP